MTTRSTPERRRSSFLRRRFRSFLRKTPLRRLVNSLRHRGLRDSDVLIAAYPRSGSTWLRFLLYDALVGEDAEFETVNRDLPDVGWHHNAPALVADSGRLIKTHEPYRLEYSKAVYLVRDPRDVVASEFRYWRMTGYYDGDFPTFVRRFVAGRSSGYGSWAAHVRSWLDSDIRTAGRLHVIQFEDLRADPVAVLLETTEFLGRPVTEAQAKKAVEQNVLRRMAAKEERARQDELQNLSREYRFINKGEAGGGRGSLDSQQRRAIEVRFEDVMTRLGYSSEPLRE